MRCRWGRTTVKGQLPRTTATTVAVVDPTEGLQRRLHAVLRAARGDGGGYALVWMLVVPLVLALVFFGIQAASNGYARSIAQAAAEAGVRAAVSSPGDASRAAPAAESFLAKNSGSFLHDTEVAVSSDGDTVTVTVTGTVTALWNYDPSPLTRTASGPLETLAEGALP